MSNHRLVRACALICVMLLVLFPFECKTFVIPSQSMESSMEEVKTEKDSLPEVARIDTTPPQVHGLLGTFQDETSESRQTKRESNRVKRDTCKDRPTTEILEYENLKLPNRCWEDCDCMEGRYCTKHNYCHDMPKP